MRIISPIHDYYDSAMVYNTSEDIIYFRDPKIFEIKYGRIQPSYPELVKEVYDKIYTIFDKYNSWTCYDKNNKWYDSYNGIQHRLIIFAGKLYPVIRFSLRDKDKDKDKDYWLYSFEELKDFFEKHELKFSNDTRNFFRDRKSENTVKEFFNHVTNYDSKIYDFLLEKKISICVINRISIKFNVKLSDYEFYKKFDAYTAYQELDMWISGTLSYPQNIMIEVQDKDKIDKHGFDKKYGFRTRPK